MPPTPPTSLPAALAISAAGPQCSIQLSPDISFGEVPEISIAKGWSTLRVELVRDNRVMVSAVLMLVN
ncbi:hypothetical protein N7481_008410 [Penicillium waksmanii]|uniref:uncharacterized protein n=1 Tax=Penicillium waksmanii TaxID=69791 RepID=UPI002549913B|nr:uncharacterized protein N7481_008410 [Penicillium waksmanii]KAJ5981112.1 hypothetical protein N7481_008410 [Penicillium waksmanii]